MKGKLSCPYRGSETPVQGRSNPRTGENADPSRGQRRSQQGRAAAAPARPKPIRAHGVGFTASELLAARNSSNETLRRRFICIATHLFVRQDSRIRVAPLTACSALRAIPSLRSALTAFGGYVLITSRFVCDSCSFHHDSSAKLILAYQTLADPTSASIQE